MTTKKRTLAVKFAINFITWALALLFLYAAASKLLTYDKFVVQIGQSAMLTPYADVLAWAVPLIEIVIAVLLVFKRLRQLGLYSSLSLMALFTGYIFIILHFTDHKPCACGGLLQEMGWSEHLIFNIVFTLLAGLAIVLNTSSSRGNREIS